MTNEICVWNDEDGGRLVMGGTILCNTCARKIEVLKRPWSRGVAIHHEAEWILRRQHCERAVFRSFTLLCGR